MSFDSPLMIVLAGPVGLVLLLGAWWARRVRVRHAFRWSAELGTTARRNGRLGPLVIGAAAVVAALALAGPRWGSRTVIAESKALNLVIALDVSRSMLAMDVEPSRLERARAASSRIIHDLSSDRIGLLAFAAESYIISPLTMDGGALQLLLDAMDPEITSAQGTGLAGALRQGRELLLSDQDLADRVLVVFTDGEAHDTLSAIESEAAKLVRDGIKLIVVAEGTTEPTQIPIVSADGEVTNFFRDQDLNYVQTIRRDDILTTVADEARGSVVSANVSDQARTVRELIANLKRTPQATTSAAQGVLRVWIPLSIALLLLLIHSFSRRTAALTGIILALAVPSSSAAQRPLNAADEAWPADPAEAARLYALQASTGEGGDTTLFNSGSAALAAGNVELASPNLGRVARSVDPDMRFRALFNLGLLHHYLARTDSVNAEEHYRDAMSVYREALLLRPGDADAKWNYELALRELNDGGGEDGDGSNEPEQREQDERENTAGLSPSEADQIFNSIMDEERRTRQRLNDRRNMSREILRGKEW